MTPDGPLPVPSLTPDGCRSRRLRLTQHMVRRDVDAVLVADPRHVHYLTGYWARLVFTRLALVRRDGTAMVVAPEPVPSPESVETVLGFASSRRGTLVDLPERAALDAIAPHLPARDRLRCDARARGWLDPAPEAMPIDDVLLEMRRAKDPDEVALIRRAILATEAGYAWARAALAPGVAETEIYGGLVGAAAAHAGEALGEFGNDFQIGALASEPRRRRGRAGEVAILDVAVTLRGYRSDMCRSLVVGGRPGSAQQEAHGRIEEALARVEQRLAVGTSCRDLDGEIRAMLHGHRGWTFAHHLGHGIGLDAHEAPRLNPDWDDVLAAGDVVAVEPALYGSDLREGLRVEQVYHLTDDGFERLTSFPTELA